MTLCQAGRQAGRQVTTYSDGKKDNLQLRNDYKHDQGYFKHKNSYEVGVSVHSNLNNNALTGAGFLPSSRSWTHFFHLLKSCIFRSRVIIRVIAMGDIGTTL